MKVARSTYAVPALEKGLAVLERLAVSPVPQGLAELAASLGRGRNELFRMCACLEAHGYIARDDVSGKWSLTLKLFTLAHGHSPVERLLVAAAAPMRVASRRAVARVAARKYGSPAKRMTWPRPSDSRVTAAELAKR